jgi:S1-C subfamily serine protease
MDKVTVTGLGGRKSTAPALGREHSVDIAALRPDDDSGLPPLHSGTELAEATRGPVFTVGAAGAVTAGSVCGLDEPVIQDGGGRLKVVGIDADVRTTSPDACEISRGRHGRWSAASATRV